MTATNPKSSSADVFAIPELLELVLLSLPTTTPQQELSSIKTILTSQTVSNTWHTLVKNSPRIRSFCYLPTPTQSPNPNPSAWNVQTTTPTHIRPNPFIPPLLLRNRRHGGSWPFTGASPTSMYAPTTSPQLWSYFFEISQAEFRRCPTAEDSSVGWREMFVTDPPFREVWCTVMRGMTGIDGMAYAAGRGGGGGGGGEEDEDGEEEEEGVWTAGMEAELRVRRYERAKAAQGVRRCCEGGFTFGGLVDVLGEMFEGGRGRAEWVVVESVRGGG